MFTAVHYKVPAYHRKNPCYAHNMFPVLQPVPQQIQAEICSSGSSTAFHASLTKECPVCACTAWSAVNQPDQINYIKILHKKHSCQVIRIMLITGIRSVFHLCILSCFSHERTLCFGCILPIQQGESGLSPIRTWHEKQKSNCLCQTSCCHVLAAEMVKSQSSMPHSCKKVII